MKTPGGTEEHPSTARGFSFRYQKEKAEGEGICRHVRKIQPLRNTIHLHARFRELAENPGRYVSGLPRGEQEIEVGKDTANGFVPVLKVGIHDDKGVYTDKCFLTPWLFDGTLDYFGGYARLHTIYDFRITISLKEKFIDVAFRGGDGDWFLLAENARLANAGPTINEVRVRQNPGASSTVSLRIQSRSTPEKRRSDVHPRASRKRTVDEGKGFTFQKMVSLWHTPGCHVTIVRKPPVWYGFPDVAKIGSGSGADELICAYCDGKSHGGGGGLYVKRSGDSGRTWGEALKVYGSNLNCQRIQRLDDGTLLLLADIRPEFDVVLFDSSDGGRTWRNERWLRSLQAGGNLGCVPSRVTELPDGSWLLASSWYPGGKPFEGTEGEMLEIYRSPDRGESWKLHSQVNEYPLHSLSEASIMVMPDGRLLMYARENQSEGLPGIKAFSKDLGKTWQVQELPFAVTGRTCAGFLRDGRVSWSPSVPV